MNVGRNVLSAVSSSLLCLSAVAAQAQVADHRLTGWAALPSEARSFGPTSGQFITAVKGVTAPFVDSQVIPGWSALLKNDDRTFLAMPDNGFGSKANSPDYVLGYYNITPLFKRVSDDTTEPGAVINNYFVAFNDEQGFLNDGQGVDLQITADFANYPREPLIKSKISQASQQSSGLGELLQA